MEDEPETLLPAFGWCGTGMGITEDYEARDAEGYVIDFDDNRYYPAFISGYHVNGFPECVRYLGKIAEPDEREEPDERDWMERRTELSEPLWWAIPPAIGDLLSTVGDRLLSAEMPDGPGDLMAVGGDLSPETLLAAYRAGIFPMPESTAEGMAWWSPHPRAVLPMDRFVPSRSLRRMMRRYQITVNRAFGEVISGCADPSRPGGWITGEVERAYLRLHELGWAHSLETWEDGELAGGLYGVSIGGFFAGESMFHRRRDASKAALARLVEIMSELAEPLLDVQWQTPHLRSLGVVEIPRSEYLRQLAEAVQAPGPDWERLSC